jgi:hypothetical protein
MKVISYYNIFRLGISTAGRGTASLLTKFMLLIVKTWDVTIYLNVLEKRQFNTQMTSGQIQIASPNTKSLITTLS